jgi:ribosomal-protein-alanine N-acetyltransferase
MEIRTERLRLREFCSDDWRALRAYQSQDAYLRYYPIEDRPVEEVKAFLETVMRWSREIPRTKYQLAVTVPEHDVVAGCCGLRKAMAGDAEAELGCELDPVYWGFGYAREACGAILAFGHAELGVRRLRANIVSENTRAVRLAEGLGLRAEGALEGPTLIGGKEVETLVYGGDLGPEGIRPAKP